MINVTPTLSTSEAVDLVNLSAEKTALEVKGLDLFYGNKQALFNVGMKIPKGRLPPLSGHPAVVNRPYCVASTA